MKCLCADAGRPGACGKCSYPEWLQPRGTSSTGGAPGCQSGGCGFEPRVPHEGEERVRVPSGARASGAEVV